MDQLYHPWQTSLTNPIQLHNNPVQDLQSHFYFPSSYLHGDYPTPAASNRCASFPINLIPATPYNSNLQHSHLPYGSILQPLSIYSPFDPQATAVQAKELLQEIFLNVIDKLAAGSIGTCSRRASLSEQNTTTSSEAKNSAESAAENPKPWTKAGCRLST